ncbi:MAG TPA: hypothetical protein VLJ62_29265, partial [Burkholderiaceae bacterium]|nr:hypothetical protein [Burkholderiaceae bacterium]
MPAIAPAQGLLPFLTTADGAISARFDGARCAEGVRMIFTGRSAESFRNGPDTARLMNNVTFLLRQQCPTLVRVTARGMADSKIVYSGLAEAATNWEVVELGSGSGSGLLSGPGTAAAPSSGPSARDLF